MTRRLSLSLVVVAAGIALLVAAGPADPAGGASTAAERKGGTLRITSITDVATVLA